MTKNEVSIKSLEELKAFMETEILSSSEAAELLEISRQSLNSLVKRGKLIPIKQLSRDTLFLREDVEKRKRQAGELNAKYRPYDN